MTTFTLTMPKRTDVTGLPTQVFLYDDFIQAMIRGIDNGTIAALGTINNGSLCFKYLFSPKVHRDLSGKPCFIIGNASDEIGEFSLLKIDLVSIKQFTYIGKRTCFPPGMTLGADFTAAHLAHTTWDQSAESISAMVLPNFFPLYFGQEPVYGDIRSEDVRDSLGHLGQGYEIWVSGAYACTKNADDVVAVVDNIHGNDPVTPDNDSIKTFLDPKWDPATSMRIASDLGPCGTIDQVQTVQYPQEAKSIKDVFVPVIPAHHAALPLQQGGAFTITSAADVEKEAEAKKGITKLLLFHIAADRDLEAGTMANISQAIPSAGMESVLTSPRAVRPQSYSDLLQKACHLASTQDPLSICSTQMTLKIIQKLAGNFATEPITSFYNEANSVDITAFLPQLDTIQINSIKQNKQSYKNELTMNILDTQRIKPKMAIACIGQLTLMEGVTSTCVNLDMVISGTISCNGPIQIIHQILLGFITAVNHLDWKHWWEHVSNEMPHFHWKCLEYLGTIFNAIATFAPDFINENMIYEDLPIEQLDTSAL